jgi:hypothetical protein
LKIRGMFAALGVIFVCVTLYDSAPGQSERGAISGRIVDSTGAVLAGARINLQPNGLSTVTNAQGEFTISNLSPGEYTVSIQYVGFGTFSIQVTVSAAQVKPR